MDSRAFLDVHILGWLAFYTKLYQIWSYHMYRNISLFFICFENKCLLKTSQYSSLETIFIHQINSLVWKSLSEIFLTNMTMLNSLDSELGQILSLYSVRISSLILTFFLLLMFLPNFQKCIDMFVYESYEQSGHFAKHC